MPEVDSTPNNQANNKSNVGTGPSEETAHTRSHNPNAIDLSSLIQKSVDLLGRSQREGNSTYLNESIAGLVEAIELTPSGHGTQAPLLHNLALAYFLRFMGVGDTLDIDQSIECWSRASSLTADNDPAKLDRINSLGNAYLQKFQRLGDPHALNHGISSFESAVTLVPNGHTIAPGLHNNLGNAYSLRFEQVGEEPDINQAIHHQTQCISLTSGGHSVNPGWVRNLGNSYTLRFERRGEIADINSAIDCHSQAVSLTPDGDPNKPGRLSNLGTAYQHRFEHSGDISDIDEAISCHLQAVSLAPDGSREKGWWLNNLGIAYGCRSRNLQDATDHEKGIAYAEKALSICPAGDARQFLEVVSNLGGLYLQRFCDSKNLDDMDKSIQYTSQAVSILPDNHPSKYGRYNNLGIAFRNRFDLSKDKSDLDRAVSLHRQALSLIPDGHSSKHIYLGDLGNVYYKRYKLEGSDPADLKHAAIYQFQGLNLCPDNHPDRGIRLAAVAHTLAANVTLNQDKTAFEVSLDVLAQAAMSTSTISSIRFHCAWSWATLLTKHYPDRALQGWELMMELLPNVVWQGHTVTRRYQEVAHLGSMVSDAISAAIDRQNYVTALEWLEERRAIIWKQILQLRTPIDELRAVDAKLASQLEIVSRNLEQTGASRLLEIYTNSELDHALSDELATQRHHRLAQEWDKIVRRVRDIPSFENFLRPNKIGNLAAVTHSGAVVAIQVSEKTCGALVLQPGSSEVTYIPLPLFSYEKATNAYKRLKHILHDGGIRNSGQRKIIKYTAPQHDAPFQFVLALLWTEVVKPVLVSLGYQKKLASDDLPHITWCATGPLSFLPLHAAGLYFDASSDEKIFNYVVSSYTPTLSALLPSSKAFNEFNGILAVGQSETPGLSALPGAVEEINRMVNQFGKSCVVRLEGDDATVDSVMSAMDRHGWVHMACHASQNSDAPGTSAFYLHDGPLRLSTIMNKSLKNAEFAFLSACQTASGDEEIPDEAAHLAAGMFMAGYHTVIATAWSIRDDDAPLVAEKVYAHLIQGGRPDHRRASKALHLAVKELRDTIGESSFVSWVPYIHIGI